MAGHIALTFDDGPDPVWTPRVLGALAASEARATFFVVAPLAERHPGLLRRITDEGHEIALHCNRHERHDRMGAGEILSDATRGLRALRALGYEARNWRAPWGVVTPDTETVAGELGLRLVGWTADSEDWRGGDAGGMLNRLLRGIGPGAIVLMHDRVGGDEGQLRGDGGARSAAGRGGTRARTRDRNRGGPRRGSSVRKPPKRGWCEISLRPPTPFV